MQEIARRMSLTDEVFQRGKLFRRVAELHQNLGAAVNEKRRERKKLWPASRNEIVGSLIAIAWFFEKLEGFGAYSNLLNEFSSALADLDRGAMHPIFAAKARKAGNGKPPDNTDLMCARCRVAIAVAYTMHAEANIRSKRTIADEIAAAYRSLGHLMRKRANRVSDLGASIVSWYDEFNQGKAKNQEARDLYRTYRHVLVISKRGRPSASADLIRIAHQQLCLAAEFVPMTIEEALSLGNFIEPKRLSKRRRGAVRHRSV